MQPVFAGRYTWPQSCIFTYLMVCTRGTSFGAARTLEVRQDSGVHTAAQSGGRFGCCQDLQRIAGAHLYSAMVYHSDIRPVVVLGSWN